MSHLKTAYVAGSQKAAADFGDMLSQGIDVPTARPHKFASVDMIVKTALKDIKAKKQRSRSTISQAPQKKKRGVAMLRAKLRQKSKKRNRG